jgi:glutaredoxin-related protein
MIMISSRAFVLLAGLSLLSEAFAFTTTNSRNSAVNVNVDVDVIAGGKHALTQPSILCGPQAQAQPVSSSSSALWSMQPSSNDNKGDVERAMDNFLDGLKTRSDILQASLKENAGFKQTVANVMAGEYDEVPIQAEIEAIIAAHPLCMFTWEASPSCKSALKAFELMGMHENMCHIVRLDDPWSKGNPMRAELGKKVGRTSVPFVFVKGTYMGGYDGGISDDDKAVGLVNMAFRGTLKPTLEAAGITFSK